MKSRMAQRLGRGLLLVLLLAGLASLWAATAQESATVSGLVVGDDGAVQGARVRVRATENLVFSASDGRFRLSGLEPGQEIEVTAWAEGHYIAAKHVTPPVEAVILTLRPIHRQDHPDYVWTDPADGATACARCHPLIMSHWQHNAHAGAVSNARFFTLYNGTRLDGTDAGPGYLKDFPDTAGNCAECHAPAAGADGYLTTDMNGIRGQVTAGIHCDYCHKIGGVYLDPGSGSVYDNAPGTRGQRLLRPPPGDNIFFGPYDDVHDPDTYLPLISESAFCAPCHQFSFWGTPIYESFDEWLASGYADRGVTCQDCHMPPAGNHYFALPEAGGLSRPPEKIPSHFQLGATDKQFVREAARVDLVARQVGQQVVVLVTVHNTNAGHHLPTDHPGRHLILTIEATDETGDSLPLRSGPRVPAWGGAQAGTPGTAYAKVLADAVTGQAPVVSYWKPARLISDNRIAAETSVTSQYHFLLPPGARTVQITAELRFRRLFAGLMAQKQWDTADIIMDVKEAAVSVTSHWAVFLPSVR